MDRDPTRHTSTDPVMVPLALKDIRDAEKQQSTDMVGAIKVLPKCPMEEQSPQSTANLTLLLGTELSC
jgi:hypothetical protein